MPNQILQNKQKLWKGISNLTWSSTSQQEIEIKKQKQRAHSPQKNHTQNGRTGKEVKGKYQKAVILKKFEVVDMEAIEPAAKTHCIILKNRLVKVPGLPGITLIFYFYLEIQRTIFTKSPQLIKIKREKSFFLKRNKTDPETEIGRLDDKIF